MQYVLDFLAFYDIKIITALEDNEAYIIKLADYLPISSGITKKNHNKSVGRYNYNVK